jgi:hypothetical protein
MTDAARGISDRELPADLISGAIVEINISSGKLSRQFHVRIPSGAIS